MLNKTTKFHYIISPIKERILHQLARLAMYDPETYRRYKAADIKVLSPHVFQVFDKITYYVSEVAIRVNAKMAFVACCALCELLTIDMTVEGGPKKIVSTCSSI